MKSLGVFICNYNKKEFILPCVRSVLNQSFLDLDVYVIDNASTDGSVEAIKAEFGDRLNVVVNDTNLGGSGGFNTGLRLGLEKEYQYIMLADNDIIMDKDAIIKLYDALEHMPELGMCGSKIMQMQKPEYIQDYGGTISFETYSARGICFDQPDSNEYLALNICDYVSACSLMVRAEVVRTIGTMDEQNFIYWDDMEWSHRCRRAGYKVAACGESRVWHNHTIKNPINTFVRYYFHRNRLYYFAAYIENHRIESFIKYTLTGLFNMVYGDYHKNAMNEIKSLMYALDDFLHGIRGKAGKDRILPINYENDPFSTLMKAHYKILLLDEETEINPRRNEKIIQKIQSLNPSAEIYQKYKEELTVFDYNSYDLILQLCKHVTQVKENILPSVYVDEWFNCITTQGQYEYFSNFDNALAMFLQMYTPLMKDAINKIRNDKNRE